MTRRVTIVDIAKAANVSKGAVSYALNGRPGVSAATRERILGIAAELGWYPHRAARALSDATARTVGLVLSRPAGILAVEPFFMELIAGIEAELSARSIGLTLQLVEDTASEIEVYRRWWAERRVDGVIVVDLLVDDPRIAAIEALGMPAVVVGGPEGVGSLSAVGSADEPAMEEVVRYLALLGHRRIGRVAGTEGFLHTSVRTRRFAAVARSLRIASTVVHTDYGRDSSVEATRRLLSARQPPTAIVYDSDVMAVAGLGVAHEAGRRVPGDLSIVSWEDSYFCEAIHPALTALSRDVPGHGARAARVLLGLIEGGPPTRELLAPARLSVRGSTGPAPDPPAPRNPVPRNPAPRTRASTARRA